MFYRNGFELESCLRMSLLKCDRSQPNKMFTTREITHKLQPYQISIYWINHYFNIVLLISRLPNIVQKLFCTQHGAMDPTFQMNYTVLHVCNQRNQAKTAALFMKILTFSVFLVLVFFNWLFFIFSLLLFVLFSIHFGKMDHRIEPLISMTFKCKGQLPENGFGREESSIMDTFFRGKYFSVHTIE